MFGLIYSLVVSAGCVLHKINENRENEENKIKFRHPNGLTYVDTKGRSRLISNNEVVFYTHDRNGDYVLENMSGHVYKNFSKEKRDKELSERIIVASQNNETTYAIDENKHEHDWFCKARRFKDFKTGDVYIIRRINYKYYYMNIANGMVVRKTDWQIKYDEANKNNRFAFKDINIEEFNEKQKTISDKYMLYREFEYNDCCNIYK